MCSSDLVIPSVLSDTLNEVLAGFSTSEYGQFKSLLLRALDNVNRMNVEGESA